MTDKTLILTTGGNQGLGYYAIQQLSATNKYHILMGSRDINKAKAAIKTLTDDASAKANPDNVEPIQIDVQSDESILEAAKTVEQKYGHLDILMVSLLDRKPLRRLLILTNKLCRSMPASPTHRAKKPSESNSNKSTIPMSLALQLRSMPSSLFSANLGLLAANG